MAKLVFGIDQIGPFVEPAKTCDACNYREPLSTPFLPRFIAGTIKGKGKRQVETPAHIIWACRNCGASYATYPKNEKGTAWLKDFRQSAPRTPRST